MQGEKCPYCGEPYEIKEITTLGHTIHVPMAKCECSKKRKQQEEEEIKQRKKHNKVMEYYRWCDIGERLQDCWFENFTPKDYNKKLYEFAKKYASEFESFASKGLGAIFTGPVGVGKTHLAVSVFREIMMRNHTAIFVRFTDLITRMEEARSYTATDSVTDLVNFFNAAEFCVLDDVGSLHASDVVRDFLYKIVDGRYQHKKPTLVTTNLDETLMKNTLGERIYDRLAGSSLFVSADGPSERSVKRGEDVAEILGSIKSGESAEIKAKKQKFLAFSNPRTAR